jgi:ADP-ribose pyrophosphatase YjhB (NUDIX family)
MFHVERSPHIEILARGLARIGDQILICRSLKWGYCYLPGGHVEFGESSADALRREFIEECGTSVRVGALQSVVEQRFVQRGRSRHELSLVFHVELDVNHAEDQPPALSSREPKIAFEWVAAGTLSTQRFFPACIAPALAAGVLPRWITVEPQST